MKITVFGATGGTGLEVVRQAAAAGHEVTAVVRDPARLAPVPGVAVVRADVMDPASIAPSLVGADAVVSALGNRDIRHATTVCSGGVASIIEAMEGANVRRLAVVSASGLVTDGADDFLTRYVAKPILQRILAYNFADLRRMEEIVRESGLDWTIVRPSRLLDRPRGNYRVEIGRNLPRGYNTRRADVADYILRSLDDGAAVGEAVAVAI
ncbi:NAD(P)-binding oxidoreductase [Sinomonas sp. JGH33]|uniref:NAD(P)-binding oxidoreductase n=1 Tax=Sinomonas terricola TaxID=3110330 RepID=A0ABU5T369_9MICC|nr:NAD(P)-binding oxidoreductase [Sinomonas sp. JGH33]MEA5454125.1 NAD(P)-binding oxidoreductase [Sinomonas sp. JGH33]